jgi:hypothetical protein
LAANVYEEGTLHLHFRQGGIHRFLKRDRRFDLRRESIGDMRWRGYLIRDLIRKRTVFAATAALLESLGVVRNQGVLVVLNVLHYDDVLGLSDLQGSIV